MLVGNQDYNSCGHFERLADLVSFDHADLAVDGMAERLTDIALGKRVTDEPVTERPVYLNDFFKGIALGHIATHIERAKTVTPRMTVVVRLAMMNRRHA
jgi:hypothetical protein